MPCIVPKHIYLIKLIIYQEKAQAMQVVRLRNKQINHFHSAKRLLIASAPAVAPTARVSAPLVSPRNKMCKNAALLNNPGGARVIFQFFRPTRTK